MKKTIVSRKIYGGYKSVIVDAPEGTPEHLLIDDDLEKGGPGSGHFGHAGRPGQRGGSAPGKGSGTVNYFTDRETADRVQHAIKARNIPSSHTDGLTIHDGAPDGYEIDDDGNFQRIGGKDNFTGYYDGKGGIYLGSGAGTATITHEIAHHVDDQRNLSEARAFKDAFMSYREQVKLLYPRAELPGLYETTGLRTYSARSRFEFFADLYQSYSAGYYDDPTPLRVSPASKPMTRGQWRREWTINDIFNGDATVFETMDELFGREKP